MEGRLIYDCFVLNEKADAIFYHGEQAVLKNLVVTTVGTDAGKSTVQVIAEMEGNARGFVTAEKSTDLPNVTFGSAVDTALWEQMTSAAVEIDPEDGHTVVRVVEVNAEGKPIAVGDAILNVG